MKAADREVRNARVLQLFVGGATYRQILVQLKAEAERAEEAGEPKPKGWALSSVSAIHKLVQLELAASAQRRALLSDEAFAMQQERTERLFSAHWPTALDPSKPGSHRSAEICRRILAQQARLEELGGDGRALPAPTRTGLPGDDAEDEEEQDELARLRAAREA